MWETYGQLWETYAENVGKIRKNKLQIGEYIGKVNYE
jgi:hypothetical protein